VDRLFQFELRKADDLPGLPVPAAAVDLAFPSPGLPLAFGRDFGASIAQRFHLGRLGRGWVDNFEITLTNDGSGGRVNIHEGTTFRLFTKDIEGAYVGLPDDFATLTAVGGGFRLREQSGEVIDFRGDGLWDQIQDANGNRLTATYTGNQLTRV